MTIPGDPTKNKQTKRQKIKHTTKHFFFTENSGGGGSLLNS